MRKQLRKFALIAIALLSSVAASAQTTFNDANDVLKYTVISGTSNVKVEAVNKSAISGDLVIPATVENGGTPYTVTEIAASGFYNADNMTSVTIPSGITTIGSNAFNHCDGLTSVSLPNTVTQMGDYVFQNCTKLASAEFSTGMDKVPSHCFDQCHAMGSITGLDNVKRLEIAAFGNCRGFTSFTIPANVEYIGQYALGDLRNCESYTFAGNKVTEIYTQGFQNNYKLKSFTMPNSVTTLGTQVFINCTALERFYFADGSTVTAIPERMFNGCSNLSYLYLPVTAPPTMGYSLFPNVANVVLDVPAEAIDTYKANSSWTSFKYMNAVGPGSADLTLADASKNQWSTYTYSNHTYLYNDKLVAELSEDNNIHWYFNNTVEKKYWLLFCAGNRSNVNETDKLEVLIYKISPEGATLVNSETVQILNCSNSVYSFANIYEQVLVDFGESLEVGKYQVKIKRLGDNGKFVWDAQVIPDDKLVEIETVVNPVGAGKVTSSAKPIIASDKITSVTLTATVNKTQGVTDWVNFTNWKVGDNVVGTEATYTFAPTASKKFVANFTPEYQTLPTPSGETFNASHAVIDGDNDTKWYTSVETRGCFGWIKNGYNFTYYINNTKPAIYNFKFEAGIGYKEANDGNLTITIEVFDADGKLVTTEVQKMGPHETRSWTCTDAYSVNLSKPLMPGNYSVRITFNHPTFNNMNANSHLCNFGQTAFELVAIVPDQISVTETAKVKVDETATLTATLSTSTGDAISVGYNTITWTSSNKEVATVDETGTVTAVAPGKATITAKAAGRTDIELTATCEVSVPQHVTDITVPGAQSIYVGEEVTLEATAAPENAEDKSLTWASSNAAVATVDQTGKVTAVAKGDAVITVTATDRNKVSKTVAVEVKQQVTGITLNKTTETINKNTTLQLSVTAYAPENATQKEVKWSSSNEGVATVSETGLVTAVAGGEVTITATAKDGKGATATCNVTVDVPVESVALDKASQNVYINDVVELTATVTPSDADQTVTWTSSEPTVASVVDGTVTAKAVGTVIITATSNHDGTKTATFTLTVMDVTAAGDGANKLLFHKVVLTDDMEANKIAWDNATDKNWVANSIVLTDANEYTNPHDVTATNLTYNRSFSNNKPQALYVPFAMNYTDWVDVAKVSYINNIHQWDDDDDGNIDRSAIEFITIKSGSTEPNMPYIITPLVAGNISINLTNATLKASPAMDGFVDCASTKTKYTLTGVYKEMDIYNTGLLALGGGNFITPEDASDKLKPFRMYLKIESRTPGTPMQMPRKITVIIDGKEVDEATAIDMLNAIGYDSDAQYNLSGTPVDNGYKGIIIKNGKKIYKK